MAYRIELRPSATKAVRKLERDVQARIVAKLDALRSDPRPHGCRKLRGAENVWRVLVGSYQIVYRIDDSAKLVTVTTVADRRDVYR